MRFLLTKYLFFTEIVKSKYQLDQKCEPSLVGFSGLGELFAF